MNRQEVIDLAESVGLLYPNDMNYNASAHMRLISKLQKFAQECYDRGFTAGVRAVCEEE